jgi:hypothetical protein
MILQFGIDSWRSHLSRICWCPASTKTTNAEKKLPTPNTIFWSNFRTPDDDDFYTDSSCMQKCKATNQYITHHSAIGRFDIPFSSVEEQISRLSGQFLSVETCSWNSQKHRFNNSSLQSGPINQQTRLFGTIGIAAMVSQHMQKMFRTQNYLRPHFKRDN